MGRVVAVVTVIVATTIVIGSGPAAAATYPVNWDALSAYASGQLNASPPPGANDWSCRPSAAHPEPVILVHGITENQNANWQALAPILANNGYCVYTITYGRLWYTANAGGIGYTGNSAGELNAFVNQVVSSTGAGKVKLVGYSEGGFISRLYMKNYGTTHVSAFVGISPVSMAPPTISGLLTVLNLVPGWQTIELLGCPACYELSTWPAFNALNSPQAAFPSVTYTNIITTRDEVATPPEAVSYLPAGPNVTNQAVQTFCPNDPVGHVGMPYDVTTVQLVLNALDPQHGQPVPCGSGLPL
ncbi:MULTISPECIES: alpha/beta fold hydrolase [unclassified Frankia]|uniref:alpha/beta fold hydrolase n=1 Tax=unclassified Frankia TaxID=2632575 RepID=UPI0020259FC4